MFCCIVEVLYLHYHIQVVYNHANHVICNTPFINQVLLYIIE